MDQNTHWSPVGAGVVNALDFATLQDAVDSLGSGGGTVMLPPGTYTLSSPLNLDGKQNIALVGMGRHYGPSKIVYTGTGARVISCRTNCSGIGIHNLHIYYTNASFTGHVIDFEGSFLSVVSDCHLGSDSQAHRTATSLINLDNAFTIVIDRNNFAQCQTAILGRSTNNNFSNVIQILGNHFSSDIVTCGIRNAGQSWLIQGNTFEPLANSGNPRPVAAYTQAFGSANVTIDGNWLGDGTRNGTWISWFGTGLTVSNNYLSNGDTGVLINGSSCAAINIHGNFFAEQNVGVNLNGEPNAQTGIVITGNSFDVSVTTGIANLHSAHKQVVVEGNHPDSTPVIVRGGSILLQGLSAPLWVKAASAGNIGMLESPGGIGVEAHIRAAAGKRGLLTFTEDSIDDRWVVGTKPADASLYFATGNSTANTDRVIVRSDGGITQTGTPRFNGVNTTGAGSAALGANCPATTTTAPYRWIQVTTSDGSTAYVPCWK